MKVLHIIDSLGLGGAQTIVKGIFEKQAENSEIFLFSLRKSEIMFEIKHPNVQIFNSFSLYSFLPLLEIRRILKRNKIDILHCHLTRSKVFGILIKLIFCPRIKLIFHEHGEIFTNATKFEDRIVKFTYNFSKLFLSKVIAVSEASKHCLIKKTRLNPDKIIVLHNFVDTERFKPSGSKSDDLNETDLNLKTAVFTIGFVGRLDKVKGCEYFIRALPYLNFDYKAIVAGDGVLRKSLEELSISIKVSDKIDFIGYVKEVEKLYHFFDLLVVPSLSESFGLSVIEAQASGVAVVASDIPGLDEVVKNMENGLLFHVADMKDLAEKITILHFNPDLKAKLSKCGFEMAQKYSLTSYISGLNRIYELV